MKRFNITDSLAVEIQNVNMKSNTALSRLLAYISFFYAYLMFCSKFNTNFITIHGLYVTRVCHLYWKIMQLWTLFSELKDQEIIIFMCGLPWWEGNERVKPWWPKSAKLTKNILVISSNSLLKSPNSAPRHWNTGLVSNRVTLNSWGSASLACGWPSF